MHFAVIQRVIGLLMGMFSLTMFPPILVSYIYEENSAGPFVDAFLLIFIIGLLLWAPVRHSREDLRTRDGFLVVVLFWIVLGFAGSIPFMLASAPHLNFTDAVFESISGLTTTGATVITGLDHLPKSILFYRQMLQWLGGMGIIVLAVAILPMLGIGGLQLYKAETPGPVKDTKLTPRITQTAKALWLIYLNLTILCCLAYWAAGMDFFDALCHSFSTIAIGGFSTHDASFAYFDSMMMNQICVLFMLIAGINFALHYRAVTSRSGFPYLKNSEFRAYLMFTSVSIILVCGYLMFHEQDMAALDILNHGLFQVVSFATTSGFTSTDYYNWPGFVPVQLIFASFIGGCASSTAGGIKVVRGLLLLKQGLREFAHLVHPHAHFEIKLDRTAVPSAVVSAIWGFFAAYVFSFSVLMVLMMMTGLDQVTAFSAVAATLNNLGPGLGDVSLNYGDINDIAKWLSCFSMLLGRLEIFTLLILFMPVFWRD